ncbi:hypothetical protein [uncultured Kordia sp.]|uniref:hypothetical protein n=1 Tax=uncultured Kordia sp. TaxID=507699 RepID=UPI00263852B6|nr:hypothetical protein [uncultured Kordia sp.]
MKKLSYLFVLLFFVSACQTDTTDTEAIENESIELKSIQNEKSIMELLQNIPENFKENPEEYLIQQLNTMTKSSDSDNDDDRYGCVTISGGIAIIDDGCTITSGIPENFKDCDRKGVRYLACGVNIDNPLCIICAVKFIMECDGRLFDVYGYNIICFPGQEPV